MGESNDFFDALVLAGRRGPSDPLAVAQATTHRAFIDVAGVIMLERVIDALRGARRVAGISVSIDDPEALAALPGLPDADSLGVHRSLSSPSRSVRDFLDKLGGQPVLVTTADHALLTTPMVDHFADEAASSDADVLVGVVAATRVRREHPETTRTFLRLRDDGYSGANLFAFRTERAARAAEFWVRAEEHRKRPWRLVSVFGLASLVLFATRRLDLDAAFDRVSHAIGVRVRPVRMPFAQAAIDVDRPSDLILAERLLRERR